MSAGNGKHLMRGVVAGVGAGLAASWLMDVFIMGPGQKLKEAVQSEQEKQQERVEQARQAESGQPKEDATMKAADKIVAAATGGQHLTMEAKQKGGPVVHYTFGALMGALYGGLAEYSGVARTGFGLGFGAALFAGADLMAVPALKLSAPLSESSPSSLANPFAAHLVYGTTTEALRRVFRAVL